jgi:hypothetical protein
VYLAANNSIYRRQFMCIVLSLCFNTQLNLYFCVNISIAKHICEISRFVFRTVFSPFSQLPFCHYYNVLNMVSNNRSVICI